MALTGKELDGRAIRVDVAGSKEGKKGGRFERGGHSSRGPPRGGFRGPRRDFGRGRKKFD